MADVNAMLKANAAAQHSNWLHLMVHCLSRRTSHGHGFPGGHEQNDQQTHPLLTGYLAG
jgi:hypothetical protein